MMGEHNLSTASELPAELSAFARGLIKDGSKSFAGASRLFDDQLRDSASLLYAWCRHCDDVVDDQILGQGVAGSQASIDERLSALSDQTLRAIDGDADEPAFEALAWVVTEHDIPRRYPLELLEGFAMDARSHHYASIEDTLLYSYHVAGVVGVMMALIMGTRDPAALHRASDLGIAFQLTNIARDVMEDAERGRVYLPQDWLAENGVAATPESVAAPESRAGVYAVVLRLLDMADDYYGSARYGLKDLPFRCACAIGAARIIYRDIGFVIRSTGEDILRDRAVVPRTRKIWNALLGVSTACRAYSLDRVRMVPPRDSLWTHSALE